MGAQSSRKLPQKIVSNVKSSAIETHSANKITIEPIIREARDKGHSGSCVQRQGGDYCYFQRTGRLHFEIGCE